MKAEGQAIGVFDSGVGGLSVLSHIHEHLPDERLHYVADSAYMPYGCKSEPVVVARCMSIANFFVEQGCKAIVVACNTATAVAVQQLRLKYDMPVIGMEPAVKPAVSSSLVKVVGILATSATVASDKFKQLGVRHGADARLIVQACPGLVEQIEKGELYTDKTRLMLQSYLAPLMRQKIDTLVLGCTHYPFLSPMIREIVGEKIRVVDTGDAIARELRRQLMIRGLLPLANGKEQGKSDSIEFWSSGDIQIVEPLMSRLWGKATVPRQLLF